MKLPLKYKILYKLGFRKYADNKLKELFQKELGYNVRIITQDEFHKEEAIRMNVIREMVDKEPISTLKGTN